LLEDATPCHFSHTDPDLQFFSFDTRPPPSTKRQMVFLIAPLTLVHTIAPTRRLALTLPPTSHLQLYIEFSDSSYNLTLPSSFRIRVFFFCFFFPSKATLGLSYSPPFLFRVISSHTLQAVSCILFYPQWRLRL